MRNQHTLMSVVLCLAWACTAPEKGEVISTWPSSGHPKEVHTVLGEGAGTESGGRTQTEWCGQTVTAMNTTLGIRIVKGNNCHLITIIVMMNAGETIQLSYSSLYESISRYGRAPAARARTFKHSGGNAILHVGDTTSNEHAVDSKNC